MPKVVYNTRRYGQFGLSHLARHYYLSDCNGFTGEYDEDDIRVDTLDRHDPMLVKCVEDLRQEAYGMEAILKFREVQDLYRIEVDRDGVEKVITPEDALAWTSARGQANVRLNLENGLAAGLEELPCSDKETIRLLVEECEYRGDTLDQCARERDEARAQLAAALEGRAMSTLNGPGEGTWSVLAALTVVEERDRLRGVCDLRLHIMERLEKERDEARAQVEWLRAEAASSLAMARIAGDKHDQKCAEVDVLRGVGCNVDGDGPCGACRKCAYRRGADEARAQLAEELLRVRAERDNAQLTFESCNRARRLAEEECDARKTSLHNCHLCRHQ